MEKYYKTEATEKIVDILKNSPFGIDNDALEEFDFVNVTVAEERLNDTIDDYEKTIEEQNDTIEELKDEIKELENENENLKDEISSLNDTIENLSDK